MRCALLLLCSCLPLAPSTDDFTSRLVEFHKHYNPFFRAYFGCPEGAADISECDPNQAKIDYQELKQLAKLAEVFSSK